MSDEKITPRKRSKEELVKIMRDCASKAAHRLPSGGFVALTSNISPSVLVEAADLLDGLHMAGVPGAVSERDAVLRERRAATEWLDAVVKFGEAPESVRLLVAWLRNQLPLRYPIPVRRRPVRVTLSDGSVWSWELRGDGSYWYERHGRVVENLTFPLWPPKRAETADDFEAIAKMLRGETEEVPEGEE